MSASIALGSRLVPHYCQARAGAGEWNGREIFSLDRPLRDGAMRAGVGGQGRGRVTRLFLGPCDLDCRLEKTTNVERDRDGYLTRPARSGFCDEPPSFLTFSTGMAEARLQHAFHAVKGACLISPFC